MFRDWSPILFHFLILIFRRPTSEYIESRDEYLYDDGINFRLRLDSAVAEELLLESDSFAGSTSSSADHSPNLADKAGRLTLNDSEAAEAHPTPLIREDHDNVSDESGYSDDVKDASEGTKLINVATPKGPYTIAEEFTLNLWIFIIRGTLFFKNWGDNHLTITCIECLCKI